VLSVAIIFFVPIKKTVKNRRKFSPKKKIKTLAFLLSFSVLTLIGSKPVEDPYVSTGKFFSAAYFVFILI